MCGSECLASDTTGQVPGDSQGLKRDYPAASLSSQLITSPRRCALESLALSRSVYLSPLVLLEPISLPSDPPSIIHDRTVSYCSGIFFFSSQSHFRETRDRSNRFMRQGINYYLLFYFMHIKLTRDYV